MIRKFFIICLVLATSNAFAASKAALITVSPGHGLFEAFGHSAIMIDSKTVYEYEGVTPSAIMAKGKPFTNLNALLTTTIPARVSKGEVAPFKLRYMTREVRIDQLNLTAKQVGVLEKDLEKAATTGVYGYNNFTSNCATMIRDNIFAVLAKNAINPFLDANSLTYRQVIKTSIDQAVKSNGKGNVEFPIRMFARGPNIKMAEDMMASKGAPVSMKSGADFDKAIAGLDLLVIDFEKIASKNPQMIANMMKLDISEAKMITTVSKSLSSFATGGALDQSLTDYDAMMVPARLNEGLAKVKNGGNALINPAKSQIIKPNVK